MRSVRESVAATPHYKICTARWLKRQLTLIEMAEWDSSLPLIFYNGTELLCVCDWLRHGCAANWAEQVANQSDGRLVASWRNLPWAWPNFDLIAFLIFHGMRGQVECHSFVKVELQHLICAHTHVHLLAHKMNKNTKNLHVLFVENNLTPYKRSDQIFIGMFLIRLEVF